MNCPRPGCKKPDSSVINSRLRLGGSVVRRRECECGYRWSTRETIIKDSGEVHTPAPRTSDSTPGVQQGAQRRTTESTANVQPKAHSHTTAGIGGDLGGASSVRSDLFSPPVPVSSGPSKSDLLKINIMRVFAHYRTYHPRAADLLSTSKEWRLIGARLREGSSVEALKRAIDGYHVSPFHMGQNDRQQKYLGLDLIMRDATHVLAGIEFSESGPPPAMNERERRSAEAAERWLRRTANASE